MSKKAKEQKSTMDSHFLKKRLSTKNALSLLDLFT